MNHAPKLHSPKNLFRKRNDFLESNVLDIFFFKAQLEMQYLKMIVKLIDVGPSSSCCRGPHSLHALLPSPEATTPTIPDLF